MSRRNLEFSSVRTEGGLLPQDVLSRIQTGDNDLPGLTPESYHLGPHERIGEAVNRSWSRLISAWRSFHDALAKEPQTSEATGLTRDRWLLPLFQELGYGRLPKGQAIEVDGNRYAVSHTWHLSPIHLLGAGVDLDRRQAGVSGAAKASPHGLVQEFLNRSEHHVWGFVSNGVHLRILRDHHSLTRQAYIEFDLQSIMEGEQYSEFMLLWMVCHQSRVEAEKPEECWLERWFNTSRDEGIRALDKLRVGVEKAIESLGTGFLAHRANAKLRDALASGDLDKQEYYRQLLRLVYRLIFLFVAEERGALLDPQAEDSAKNRYLRFYAARRLRALSDKRRGGPHFDLWQGLRFVMSQLDNGCRELALPALGSRLWSPDACPWLMDAECSNEHLLDAVRHISNIEEGRTRYAVNWRNVGADELGGIYEGLLELHPTINKEAATFVLETAAGHERKTTGSYYTPGELVDCLLDWALDPVLDAACKKTNPEAAILEFKVCDPACGSGHFLVAAARRIAKRLAAIRAGEDEPSPREVQRALRDVVSSCIYGVDVNPMAVELCKVSLWIEAIEPGRPLSFLDSHIQCGNALLGATPALMGRGIPDDAFSVIEGDDKSVASELRKQNRNERKANESGQSTMFGEFDRTTSDVAAVIETTNAIESARTDDIDALRAKQGRWENLTRSPEFRDAWFRADAWCSAFMWPKTRSKAAAAITEDRWRRIGSDVSEALPSTRNIVRDIAHEHRFFHWHLAFPRVFHPSSLRMTSDGITGWSGGFDVVLGNPPWEKIQAEEEAFFASRAPQIAKASSNARKRLINALSTVDPALLQEWLSHKRRVASLDQFLKASGRFKLTGIGKLNSYAVFAENAVTIVASTGCVGYVLPLGIVADRGCQALFWSLLSSHRFHRVAGFENEGLVFTDVHHSFKFALTTIGGAERPSATPRFKFYCRKGKDARDNDGYFTITTEDVRLLNPGSLTCPVFRSAEEFRITSAAYGVTPALMVKDSGWSVDIHRILNASDDAAAFVEVIPEAHRPPRVRDLDGKTLVPVLEAKMFHQFDHRFGSYVGQTEAQANQGKLPELTPDEHADPLCLAQPRHWVSRNLAEETLSRYAWKSDWLIAVRDVTSPVVYRTAIAAITPRVPSVHTVWNVFIQNGEAKDAAFFVAAFNSFALDFIARQKISGVHLSAFVIEQLPIPKPELAVQRLRQLLGGKGLSWFSDRVLELSYTAWDLEGFASDLENGGPPFRWDEERRFWLLAELDAIFFQLYGIARSDLEFVMNSFWVLRNDEEKQHRTYRTKAAVIEIFDRMQRDLAEGASYQTVLAPPPADPQMRHPETTRPEWAFASNLPLVAVPPIPAVVPAIAADQEAAIYVWALLHAAGGSMSRMDLARAFTLRSQPALLTRFAPPDIQDVAGAWACRVVNRSVPPGALTTAIALLANRNAIKQVTNTVRQSVITTSAHTPPEDKLDEWFRFEARLALRVLRALPTTHAHDLDATITDADRVLPQAGGVA